MTWQDTRDPAQLIAMHFAHVASDACRASALGDGAVRTRQSRRCVPVQPAAVSTASAPRLRGAAMQAAAGGHRRVPAAAAGPAVASGPADEVLAAYRKLQNGSDVRGVALPGIQGQDVTLTTQRAFHLAAAFAHWLAKLTNKPASALRVSVGTDPRLSGPDIMDAVLSGLQSGGAQPVRMGLCTTPACFMSCITPGHAYDASIMLTASHLPWNRNGMKFFTQGGGLGKKDISALVDGAAALDAAAKAPAPLRPAAPVSSADFLPVYAAQLVDLIRKGVAHPQHFDQPLKGFKIVVDAGNGSGGFFASHVLQPLGADTAGSQFLDPDGNFPNHIPNPEDAEAVASAAQAVKAASADLGIVFDTDVDRSAIIDRSGAAINRNRLIALLAAIVLRERPGATIVTDSVTSDGLAAFITSLGGKHFRYRRGYKNVIDKGVELAGQGVDAPLMIETSGHGAMAANHYLDDGAYLAVKVLIEAGRRKLAGQGPVEQLVATLREPAEEAEFRLPIRSPDFKAVGGAVISAFTAEVDAGGFSGWVTAPDNHEGVRASIHEGQGRKGWALLRNSLHDPLLVLNVESETPGGVATATHAAHCWLAQTHAGELDLSALDKMFAPGGQWERFDEMECNLASSRLGGGACGDLTEACEVQW